MTAPSTTPVLDALNHAGVPKTDDDGPIGPALRIAVLACERDELRAEVERLREDADRLAAALAMARGFLGMAIRSPNSAAWVADEALCAHERLWAARDRVLRDAGKEQG